MASSCFCYARSWTKIPMFVPQLLRSSSLAMLLRPPHPTSRRHNYQLNIGVVDRNRWLQSGLSCASRSPS